MSLVIFAVLVVAQESDRLFTTSGDEIRGTVSRIEPDGGLVVTTDKGARTVPLEDLRRIQFEDKPQLSFRKSDVRLRPRCGGALGGIIESIDAERVTFKGEFGTCAFRRAEVLSISFGESPSIEKELQDDRDHVLFAPEGLEAKEGEVVSGDLESMDAGRVRIGGTEVPRTRLREIRFRAGPVKEPALGLFARVQLKSGDGLVGMLRAVEGSRIQLFTHYAGVATIEKKTVHSIMMVPQARLQTGNILLTNQAGVTEIDRQGTKVWSYTQDIAGCSSARKLANGNVLIAHPNSGRIVEIRPFGATGGKVVWSQESLQYPCDAQRLENGNTIVAEYGNSRLAEFQTKDAALKWSTSMSQVMFVEKLEAGVLLVSISQGPPVEIETNGRVRQRYTQPGVRECRATPTAEGTILLADGQGVQVIEVDRKNNVIWKQEAAQPRMAIRLDDGSTIILRRTGELTEVDSAGTSRKIGHFHGASFISVY